MGSPSSPVLGIDTATHTVSVAVADAQGHLLAQGTLDASGRSDDLLVLIDDVCRRAGVAPGALAAVAVGAGPGSFTGLRIGMATAKGIAFAAGCPLWLASSLHALADEAASERTSEPTSEASAPLVVAALDARRGEVYCGFFGGSELTALGPEQVVPPEQLAELVAQIAAPGATVAYCGDALESYPEALAALASGWLSKPRTPGALSVIRLALRGARHDDLTNGRPAYLRLAEAEAKYPDGVPGALRARALDET